MKYISRLILTEQEAKDNIHDYEISCCQYGDSRPAHWNIMTDQEKIDFIYNEAFWFQSVNTGIDVTDVLRSVEIT